MPTHLFSKQKIHANRKVCMDTTFSIGGDKRDRTADLLNAIQALSQLSYSPRSQILFRSADTMWMCICQGFLFSFSILAIEVAKERKAWYYTLFV